MASSPLPVISTFRCWIVPWLGMMCLWAPATLGSRALLPAGPPRFRLNLASEVSGGKAYSFIYSITLGSAAKFSSAWGLSRGHRVYWCTALSEDAEPEPVHGAMLHHPFWAAPICAFLQPPCTTEEPGAVPLPVSAQLHAQGEGAQSNQAKAGP